MCCCPNSLFLLLPEGVPLVLFAGQNGFLVIFGKKMFFTGIRYYRRKFQPDYIQRQIGCKQPLAGEISEGGETEMPDDPRIRGPHDRKRQNRQPNEVRYAPKRKTPGTVNRPRKK